MAISDWARAEHYLRYIGYFRLSGYWYPFQHSDGAFKSKGAARLTFEDVLDIYVFDRKLRVLLMDALERVEVAIRALISDTMALGHGPHWYLEPVHFEGRFDHAEMLKRVRRDSGAGNGGSSMRSFIQDYYKAYSDPPLPPSWMAFEVISFGAISGIYKGLEKPYRQEIAKAFGFPQQRLISWFHALTHLRNLCAHHERVWNRVFAISPSIPKGEKDGVPHPKKLYVQVLVLQSLLLRISRDKTHWAEKLRELLEEHPEISTDEMGFPPDWEERPIWRSGFKDDGEE